MDEILPSKPFVVSTFPFLPKRYNDGADIAGPGIDTPTMERLRPKPIDVNNITVTPQRLPDTQPSPGRVQALSEREELSRVEGERLRDRDDLPWVGNIPV